MRFDWLLLTIPTALIAMFAEPGTPAETDPPVAATVLPPAEGEWQQRADYDINLAHTNIRDCNERVGKLQAAIDAINARCRCGQQNSSVSPTAATVAPTAAVRAAQPVRRLVKQCVNGVCRMVPVDEPVAVTETITTTEVPAHTWRRSYGSAGGYSYGSAGGTPTTVRSTPLRNRVRGLLCR